MAASGSPAESGLPSRTTIEHPVRGGGREGGREGRGREGGREEDKLSSCETTAVCDMYIRTYLAGHTVNVHHSRCGASVVRLDWPVTAGTLLGGVRG